jgi:hypothetical protein
MVRMNTLGNENFMHRNTRYLRYLRKE